MIRDRSFLMQPMVTLTCHSYLWDKSGVIQSEQSWVDTIGMGNLILEVMVYDMTWQGAGAALSLEGTDNPAGQWTMFERIDGADLRPTVLRLSHKRSRAARSGRLWRLVRWRWHQKNPETSSMWGSTISFKIKAVVKP